MVINNLMYRTVCVCVCIPLQMASHRYSDNICEWRSWKKGEREGASPPSAALLRRWHTCTSKLKCSLLVWQSEAGGTVQMLLLAVNYTFGDRYVFNLGKDDSSKQTKHLTFALLSLSDVEVSRSSSIKPNVITRTSHLNVTPDESDSLTPLHVNLVLMMSSHGKAKVTESLNVTDMMGRKTAETYLRLNRVYYPEHKR